jgi:hypothetical protein
MRISNAKCRMSNVVEPIVVRHSAFRAPAPHPLTPLRGYQALPDSRGRKSAVFALLSLLPILTIIGCGPTNHSTIATVGGAEEGARLDASPDNVRVAALTKEIANLSPKVDRAEAAIAARRAILYSRLLADTYHINKPVELNNVLIHLGIHQRGLCYELADDLNAELQSLHLRTLTFTRATAWWDYLWKEHNAVIVRAPNQNFRDGLALDPWRNAGVLRWSLVKNDIYPWQPREPDAPITKPGLK